MSDRPPPRLRSAARQQLIPAMPLDQLLDTDPQARRVWRAGAGAASFRRQAALQECLQEAEEQVARLKEELDDDPSAPSRRHAAARERAAQERHERVAAALARLPELEARKKPGQRDQARCSTTDREATVMKMADGGFRPAYNVQFSTDTGSLVIAAVAVTTQGSDA